MTANPSAASRGATVVLTGSGFSLVAPENVVTAGGRPSPAAAYQISEGEETISFAVPPDATAGEGQVFVTVEGETSNALTFTVTP